jgi:hypothetical protein
MRTALISIGIFALATAGVAIGSAEACKRNHDGYRGARVHGYVHGTSGGNFSGVRVRIAEPGQHRQHKQYHGYSLRIGTFR